MSVSPDLTPEPAAGFNRRVENKPYIQFVQRTLRAAGERIAEGDIEGLPLLMGLQDDLDNAIARAVEGLHDECEFSWANIADRLNITRQTAHQRWSRRDQET